MLMVKNEFNIKMNLNFQLIIDAFIDIAIDF